MTHEQNPPLKRRRSTQHEPALARRRVELIVQVQNGLLSAQAAAHQLGISRQTYYKWEQRALQAMVTALSNRRSGRPARLRDPEKVALQRQNRQLQKQLQVLLQLRRLRPPVLPPDKKKE
jgi:transposase